MAAVAALIDAGADPDMLKDLSSLGFDFDMTDTDANMTYVHTEEESDDEFARIREENNNVQALVDAVGKVLGPKQLKRYIRCV